MATKKKSTANHRDPKRTLSKKVTPMKKANKKNSAKRATPKKQFAKNKAKTRTKPVGKKSIRGESAALLKQEIREKSRGLDTVAFAREELGPRRRSNRASGDLQGLSTVENADSESVAELLEEGNAFEADVVAGVEDTPDADQGPIRTHEVPEDDVLDEEIPDEYRHKE